MAEKKIVRAEGERKPASGQIKVEGNSTGLRIGAIALWAVALAMEVICVLFIGGKATFMAQLTGIILFLILDAAACIAGSLLWKKANHIDPASEANKTKFWLQNNLGVIIACLAFIPVIVYLLTKKDLDPKTKTIGTVVAVVALAVAGLFGYDFNPVSQEDLQEMYTGEDVDVYWVATGTKYHTHADCQHLNASTQDEIVVGSIGQAEEAGKAELCKTCYKRDLKEKELNGESSNMIPETTEGSEEETSE